MTRGRDGNHAWVTTTPTNGDGHDTPGLHQRPSAALDLLKQTLATTGIEPSATEQLDTLHRAAQYSWAYRSPTHPGVTVRRPHVAPRHSAPGLSR